jgi:hypothetical protein
MTGALQDQSVLVIERGGGLARSLALEDQHLLHRPDAAHRRR